jgi:hypothetical protein
MMYVPGFVMLLRRRCIRNFQIDRAVFSKLLLKRCLARLVDFAAKDGAAGLDLKYAAASGLSQSTSWRR